MLEALHDYIFHATLVHVLKDDIYLAIEKVYAFALDHFLTIQVLCDASFLDRFLIYVISVFLHLLHSKHFIVSFSRHQVDITPSSMANFSSLYEI